MLIGEHLSRLDNLVQVGLHQALNKVKLIKIKLIVDSYIQEGRDLYKKWTSEKNRGGGGFEKYIVVSVQVSQQFQLTKRSFSQYTLFKIAGSDLLDGHLHAGLYTSRSPKK
jgi:hypothetical protein